MMTKLTTKEHETVRFVLKGYSNRGIAEEMGISANTVKSHLSKVFSKLQVNSRKELIIDLYF
jgi:LuxR family maltose regulon positive regulatory protein